MMSSSNYIEVLPIHPQPKEMESFSSWLQRLAVANGITKLRTFIDAFLPNATSNTYRYLTSMPDRPPVNIDALGLITAISEARLLETTFHHLYTKFFISGTTMHATKFLQQSIASTLRFCPLCLREDSHYDLRWRFLAVTDCPLHGCSLESHCEHCHSVVPIIIDPLRIGSCPKCGYELAQTTPTPMIQTTIDQSEKRFAEFTYLLKPQAWEGKLELRRLGQQLETVQNEHSKTVYQLASDCNLNVQRIRSRIFAGSTEVNPFRHYVTYTTHLGIGLDVAFEHAASTADLMQNDGLEWTESEITAKVIALSKTLPLMLTFTPYSVANALGIQRRVFNETYLKKYPKLNTTIKELAKFRFSERGHVSDSSIECNMNHELNDEEWKCIEPLIVPMGQIARRLVYRKYVNGILWVLKTGAWWNDLPVRYGKVSTVSSIYRRWQKSGVWAQILDALPNRILKRG